MTQDVEERDPCSIGGGSAMQTAAEAAEAAADGAPACSGSNSMLARLAAKDAARRAERAARQAAVAEGHDPREDAERLLGDLARGVSDRLAALKAATAAVDACSSNNSNSDEPAAAIEAARAAANEAAQAALAEAARLEEATAAAAYYLPAYDLKQASAALAELRAAAEAARAAAAPRRKFAFSSRKPRAAAAATKDAAAPALAPPDAGAGAPDRCGAGSDGTEQHQHQQPCQDSSSPAAATAAAAAAAAPPPLTPHEASLLERGAGVAGLNNAVIVRTSDQLQGGEFFAADLTDCQLWLLGPLRALRLARLARCTVVAAPIAGAAFVDGADACALYFAAHQVRLHNMQSTDAYLRVRSRPVIEHCAGVRFAPLTDADLAALGVAELAAAAQLACDSGGSGGGSGEAEAGSGNAGAGAGGAGAGVGAGGAGAAAIRDLWRCVDDFGWIKASASPHWAVLAEAGRRPAPLPPPAGETS